MTVHLVTFSDQGMRKSAELCEYSAYKNGIGAAWSMRHEWFQQQTFYGAHLDLLSQPRGLGFWAFKPWAINKKLSSTASYVVQPSDGDIVVWADAGIEFINNVNYIIDRMDQDIFLFGNMWEHSHWCKADIVEEVWPDPEWPWGDDWAARDTQSWARFGKQVQASVVFFRVSDYTRKFVKEWLDWCLFDGGRLIDDSPSRLPNHPEFRENRHDQAILTTMAYREGIRLHWWPAQYNDGAFIYERGVYPDEGYPVLFSHHRKRNADWEQAA